MLWVYDQYKYVDSYSAEIDFSRQILAVAFRLCRGVLYETSQPLTTSPRRARTLSAIGAREPTPCHAIEKDQTLS